MTGLPQSARVDFGPRARSRAVSRAVLPIIFGLMSPLGATACEQEPPPGLGSTIGSSGEGVVDERLSFFPLVEGAVWEYVTQNSSGQTTNPRTVTLRRSPGPESSPDFVWYERELTEVGHVERTLIRDRTRVAQIREGAFSAATQTHTTDYDSPSLTWIDDGWVDQPGKTVVQTHRQREYVGSEQPPSWEWRTYEFELRSAFEPVTVPAGTFGCAKVRRTRLVGEQRGEVVDTWFARGVGIVSVFRPDLGEVDSLASVEIPGGVMLP